MTDSDERGRRPAGAARRPRTVVQLHRHPAGQRDAQGRGAADCCKRHQALDRVQGETVYRALRAKIKNYEEAMGQADKILTKTIEDVKGHRNTAQELVATRLRVNELHDLNSDARRQLDALPKPTKGEELGGALAAYLPRGCDNEMAFKARRKAKLHASCQGIQVTVRGGFDTFFDRTDNNPVFILLEVGVNLGVFWQGTQNDRALAGRKRMVREQHQVQLVDTTVTHLKDEMEAEGQREQETAALESDLAKQIAVIEQIGGDDNMRVRDSVWFDYIKVKAEHA